LSCIMIKRNIQISLSPHQVFSALYHIPGAIFLETQKTSPADRYSFIAWEPEKIFRCNIDEETKEDFFAFIDIYSDDYFLAGYVGYEACQWMEDLPSPGVKDCSNPHIYLGAYPSFLVFDHIRRSWTVWEKEKTALLPKFVTQNFLADGGKIIRVNQTKKDYVGNIGRVLEYIGAGDVYQINYTQRFHFAYGGNPFALYLRLREVQPVAYGAFINTGDGFVISGSPELFLRIKGEKVLSKPMKGTRKRSDDPIQDEKLARELRESTKDQAENIMIVDLMRNDIGRFCDFGSIRVPKLYEVQKYNTVYQMVSHVTGIARNGISRSDIIRSVFPPGSITGAPKKRAMEIIYELEPTQRGVYCGTIGYMFGDEMVFNVAIRTIELADGVGVLGVGGGIVADSEPEKEYEESLLKSKAAMIALGIDL
jgi:aminodeoxychorismate synthase component I